MEYIQWGFIIIMMGWVIGIDAEKKSLGRQVEYLQRCINELWER